MGSKNTSVENAFLDHVLGGPDAPVSNLWLALSATEMITDPDPFMEFQPWSNETPNFAPGYARIRINRATAQWTLVNGVCSNSVAKVFTAGIDPLGWPVARSWGLFGAAEGGGLPLWWGSVVPPTSINTYSPTSNVESLRFAIGALTISET